MAKILALLFLAIPSLATMGVDLSAQTDFAEFSCLFTGGETYAVVRGYMASGQVDPNAVSNIQNAWNSGMDHVDVYLFPCVPCGNPAGQATTLVNTIRSLHYRAIWIDVENFAWRENLAANQNFILQMVSALQGLGQNVGIFTSYSDWASIVGLNWSGCASLPLWYAHYDGNPSYADFTPFGGWTHPNMKQYEVDVNECGVAVNLNYYLSS